MTKRSVAKRWTIGVAVLGALLGTAPAIAQDPRTVTIALAADPVTLDPNATRDTTSNMNYGNMFEGLYDLDAKGQPQPSLATAYRLVDTLTWEFKLRPGVKFHNGEAFDAQAVKFTYERTMDPNFRTGWRTFINPVERVEVMDPMTLRIVTKRPFPTFLNQLAYLPIVPPKYVQEKGAAVLREEPGRDGTVQVCGVGSGHATGPGGVQRVLGARSQGSAGDHPTHSRAVDAHRGAGNRRRRHPPPGAAGPGAPPPIGPEGPDHRLAVDPGHDPPDQHALRQPEAEGPAGPSGHQPRDQPGGRRQSAPAGRGEPDQQSPLVGVPRLRPHPASSRVPPREGEAAPARGRGGRARAPVQYAVGPLCPGHADRRGHCLPAPRGGTDRQGGAAGDRAIRPAVCRIGRSATSSISASARRIGMPAPR